MDDGAMGLPAAAMNDDERSNNLPPHDEMLRRMQTDFWEVARYALLIVLGAVLIGFAIRIGIQLAHGETPGEWFKLVVALEKQDRCLYGPDRAFLREMVNTLTVDENAIPNAAQQRWLRSLKRECKL